MFELNFQLSICLLLFFINTGKFGIIGPIGRKFILNRSDVQVTYVQSSLVKNIQKRALISIRVKKIRIIIKDQF